MQKEIDHIVSSVRDTATNIGNSLRQNPSVDRVARKVADPPVIDPFRFKRILLALLTILVVIEIVGAFGQAVANKQWGRFAFDLIIAGLLVVLWERITTLLRDKKEEYRRRMEAGGEHIRLWDALLFSLLWSDEIYSDIPGDRRRLVVISFTLIILGLLALYWSIGPSLMPLVIAGALVLAAVNLLAWVVSLERGEKESLQTELKIAHDVQVALMPTEQPRVPGFDVAGMSLPAKEVGGDHFDFACLNTEKSKLAISVFDVSGKGMEAAMSAVFTSGAFASEIKECASPAMLLTNLNRSVFAHRKRGHFVAFMLTVIDTATKSITYANAGQTNPLLLSGSSVQWLSPEGVHFPLGMQEQTAYAEHTVQLHSGDVLFLLTDGFTEAMNAQGELFTGERLEQVVLSMDARDLKAEEILHFVTQQVQAFVRDAPQHDDMTMVVVKAI